MKEEADKTLNRVVPRLLFTLLIALLVFAAINQDKYIVYVQSFPKGCETD